MKEKETYQAPVVEEMESTLERMIVHGESGMNEPEPPPNL